MKCLYIMDSKYWSDWFQIKMVKPLASSILFLQSNEGGQ